MVTEQTSVGTTKRCADPVYANVVATSAAEAAVIDQVSPLVPTSSPSVAAPA